MRLHRRLAFPDGLSVGHTWRLGRLWMPELELLPSTEDYMYQMKP